MSWLSLLLASTSQSHYVTGSPIGPLRSSRGWIPSLRQKTACDGNHSGSNQLPSVAFQMEGSSSFLLRLTASLVEANGRCAEPSRQWKHILLKPPISLSCHSQHWFLGWLQAYGFMLLQSCCRAAEIWRAYVTTQLLFGFWASVWTLTPHNMICLTPTSTHKYRYTTKWLTGTPPSQHDHLNSYSIV